MAVRFLICSLTHHTRCLQHTLVSLAVPMKPMERPDGNDDDMASLLRVAIKAARAGGERLVEWQGKFAIREKSPADLVTDADLASQQAVAGVIAEHYPDHAFLGEEGPGQIRMLLEEPFCWVVDPLDGTTNYVHGFPAYAVSVAAVVRGEVTVGVVFDPVHDRVYSAKRGGGACLDDEPIRTSKTSRLSEALVALSLPPQADGRSPDVLDLLAMIGRCRGIRRTGSAALNLAYVAQGVLDAYWARVIHPWDVAAGVLLIREAGGVVTASDGGPLDLVNPHFAAAGTEALHTKLLEVLRESRTHLVDG